MTNIENYGTYKKVESNYKLTSNEIQFHLKYFLKDLFYGFLSIINNPCCTEIIPNLYVSNITFVNDKDLLKKLKIKNIISICNKEVTKYENYNYYHFSVEDNLQNSQIEKFYNELDHFVEIIRSSINNNEPILIHCYRGSQRSCSLISAYLMKYEDHGFLDSIKFIKIKHPRAFLMFIHFRKSLLKYQTDIIENNIWFNV
jgi:protein-tyrosine phosphatase